ncbi:ABC-type Fe3+-siderophore transport system, permease component [Candidatus Endolissoclinum faulkneri L5]|uniref:ABC-type Fe3+-siderophore transport system, permease component n=1 Tax=Candidatus Endolissoclinum faulkneri L5 TaxID=1401328 RepID=V9TUG2_9PROT|nr:iron ABC transporter permease [Candidatus Endolissoclinum faulkneri]AHC73787.1 ABC-type Fe3+-siderophore transport system, permease component [Candidatus Endolissoclinum faulkneri L5]
MIQLVEISDRVLLSILAITLAVVALISLYLGPAQLTILEIISALFGKGTNVQRIIVIELRFPRVILGIMLGGMLGFSGAALQGLLRNPLADPGIIGVTAAAGMGAVIAIGFGMAAISLIMIPLAAIISAALATMLLCIIAIRNDNMLVLILTGISISSLSTALTSLAFNLAPDPITLRDMILWLLGSLENRTTTDLAISAPFVLLGWLIMANIGRSLDAMSLGEETAKSLGINVKLLRWRIILGVSTSVGAIVSVCGAVGFVGLVIPHMVRPFVGYQPRRLLLASALGGAILITLADLVTRIPTEGIPIQLGVVTALIGSPMFIWIIQRYQINNR